MEECTKDYCCRLIRYICDGDLAQTDELALRLREAWTVAALRCIAEQLTAAGCEW